MSRMFEIIVADISKGFGSKSLKKIQLNSDEFKTSLQEFTSNIEKAIPEPSQESFELAEFIAKIEVNSKGGISLIGTAELGASAGIELKFVKRNGK